MARAQSREVDFLLNGGWVLLGMVLLYFGAEWLVKGSSELALKFGLSPLIVGLTVVAFGTSAPELLVSVAANMKTPPQGDMALGNVVGSNIANFALVLGITALIRPISIHAQLLKREMPILIGATFVFVAMIWDREISRWEGGLLAAAIVIYTIASIRRGQKGGEVDIDLDLDEEEIAAIKKAGFGKMLQDVLLVVIGIAALTFGANRLVTGGEALALALGVTPAVVALTLFALGTSLPEVATSIVASLKGEGDLATGNVVGSCLFNLLAVVGITGSISPLSANELRPADVLIMTGVTLGAAVMMKSRMKLERWEGLLFLSVFAAYNAWLFLR